jgi:hypothetical protein
MIQHDANALPGGEIPPAGYRLVDMDNDPIRGPEASRLMENIRYCHTLGLPTFFDQMKPWRKVSPTIICGFAPSMQGQLKTIRALKKKKGSTLICANAAHNWLLKKGIKPDIMILLDIDADYIKYVGRPRKGVKYFVASQCAPEVFDHLIKYKADITVWHSWQPEANELVGELWADVPTVCVAGGSSTPMRAINLALVAGHSDFHLFGMDSSYPEGGTTHIDYSVKAPENNPRETVWYSGKEYHTTAAYRSQALGFHMMMVKHHDLFMMKTYGEGLLQHIHRTLQPQRYDDE